MSSNNNCLELSPAPPCGIHGTCLPLNTSISTSICICDEGWSQSLEMGIYFVKPSELSQDLCTHNNKLLLALYILALALLILAIITQISQINRKKQLYRLSAIIFGLFLSIVAVVYRLFNFTTANFGEDVIFTFLVANSLVFDLQAVQVFFQRYINYLSHRLKLSNKTLQRYTILFKKAVPYVAVFDIVGYQLFWISVLLKHGTAIKIVRLAFALTLFRTIYTYFMALVLLNQFIFDMKTLVAFTRPTAMSGSSKNSKELLGVESTPGRARQISHDSFEEIDEDTRSQFTKLTRKLTMNRSDLGANAANLTLNKSRRGSGVSVKVDDTTVWIRRQLPKTIQLKWTILIFGALWFVFMFLPAAFPLWLHLFGYVIPVIFICWSGVNFTAMRTHKKTGKGTSSLKTSTKKTATQKSQTHTKDKALHRDPSFSFYQNTNQGSSVKEIKGMLESQAESQQKAVSKSSI